MLGGLAYVQAGVGSVPASDSPNPDADGRIHTVKSLTNGMLLGCRKPLYTRDKRSSANPVVLVERERNEEGRKMGKAQIILAH